MADYFLDLTVANRVSVDLADQKLVITDSPSAYTIQLDNGDLIAIPTGRIGTIHRADGQPLGRVIFIAPGGGAGIARFFVDDRYCVEIT